MGRGLILAAPASGSGKTLATLGLVRALRRRGLRVGAAKVGPDYIDPGFHAAAGGLPCRNLDPWAMRPETLAALTGELEAAADIVVCEGVMGLFDGTGASGEEGSTAALARMTGWPVVLVLDAAGQGASAAALVRGFAGHDKELPLAGVVLNRIASERHRVLVKAALTRHVPDVPCLGAIPAEAGLALPSRHLGLVPAGEIEELAAVVERAADRIAAGLDLDRLLLLARGSRLGAGEVGGVPPLGGRIAVARDAAFVFAYPGQIALWQRQGAEIVPFSPLADEAPDAEADAVFLPGGYPELWAERLAGAAGFLTGLRRAAAAGKPVYGECGGYMVLGDSLTDAAGRVWPMGGLLPLATSFAERRRHLGYRRAEALCDTVLGAAGLRFRAHEFHYATTIRESGAAPLFAVTDAAGGERGHNGLRRGSVFGSFIHLIDRE